MTLDHNKYNKMNYSQDICDRFWEKVKEPENENCCWEWDASKTLGYGHFGVNGKLQRSHRFSYEYFNGPIPPGKIIMHKCDNPGCQKHNHLELGTQKENVHDCVNKGRMNRPKGSDHGMSKLTNELVWEMLNLINTGILTTADEISERFDISEIVIYNILNGLLWKDITDKFPINLLSLKKRIIQQAPLTEDEIKIIIQQRKLGDSYNDIAKKLGRRWRKTIRNAYVKNKDKIINI